VIWEGESAYQFIQVQATADGGRVLHLNEGWADHSVWHRNRVLTGGYWDQFLLAPVMHGRGLGSLAMIGYAGGTVGRAYGTFWPATNVLGIELDPEVTAAGRRYFGLASNPRVRVATADGRPYLATHATHYDAIFLDAFRQPYIPFYLTTQEFWKLADERLRPGGMVMANVGTIPGDEPTERHRRHHGDGLRQGLPLACRWLQRDRGRVHAAGLGLAAACAAGGYCARARSRRRFRRGAATAGAVQRPTDRRSRAGGMAD